MTIVSGNTAAHRNLKFLLIGPTGSGKTSQLLTLPGKKFAYFFDPNAPETLASFRDAGADLSTLDYELVLPDQVDISAVTLKKGVRDVASKPIVPNAYPTWEKEFLARVEGKFFDAYDVLAMDSMTTFLDLLMDRILYLNGRTGKQPEQDDWAAQINTVKGVFRLLTSLPGRSGSGLILFAAAHHDLKQDDLSKRIEYQIALTGQLRRALPLLFSDIYTMSVETTQKEPGYMYKAQTRPDSRHPLARCTLGLDSFVDMTIYNPKKPEEYGLGAIVNKKRLPIVEGNSNAGGK